jgi:hypothetical protein
MELGVDEPPRLYSRVICLTEACIEAAPLINSPPMEVHMLRYKRVKYLQDINLSRAPHY